MVGKNPHRPEGKARADNEHMAATYASAGAPREHPSDKAQYDQELENIERGGGPTVIPAEEAIGGSRPGVPSRVKDAIAAREED